MQTSKANNPAETASRSGGARSIEYLRHLEIVSAEESHGSKGEATRHCLLLAAAQILQDGGYHDLRISQVVKKAGVSRGTFYIYFADKSDIVLSVLSDFRDVLLSAAYVELAGNTWEERVYSSNLLFAQIISANSGLIKAFRQLVDEADDFRKMRHVKEQEWSQRQFAAFTKRFGAPKDEETRKNAFRRMHALRVMIERLCTQIYVEQMADLIALYPTPQDVAEVCTDIWVSTLTRTAAGN